MPPKLNKKGQYEFEFSQGGRRVHRVLPKRTTYRQAVEKETKLRREIFDTDELGHETNHTIGEAILKYLGEYTGKAKRQTENHAKALRYAVHGRGMAEIREAAKTIATTGERITRSTRNRRLAILRRVSNLAYARWGWIKAPIKIELLPENPARQVYLNRPELAALLWKIKNREARRAAYALAFTGLRKGELLGLEPDDIRGNVICLGDTKTGSPRNVPIIRKARWAFRRPFEVLPTYLSHAVQKASGGKVRVHDLRHTTASLLINAGVPLYTVGAILGHKSLQTTKRYAHLSTKTLETAMGKLERMKDHGQAAGAVELPASRSETGNSSSVKEGMPEQRTVTTTSGEPTHQKKDAA